ncbi:beta-1,6-N-acetylglucosaminyltransferase [Tatumella terrea]|uniref:beta-1,6-N-acetylglucosaminyltransferase n=1 Tax=Tatumella terrea TaxID=419007 RepID=UPI0031DA47D0
MSRQAFLILTHKPIPHILKYADLYPDVDFYIHFDMKVEVNDLFDKKSLRKNTFILPDDMRVDVRWAGFSMVLAMINLLRFATELSRSDYFHFVSADDMLFIENCREKIDHKKIYIEYKESIKHRYRLRFNTFHADKKWQTSFFGKVYTFLLKALDRLTPWHHKINSLFGSQWFSISKEDAITVLSSITIDDINFFRRKLCPDEHFFQYIIKKANLQAKVSPQGNLRYIIFDKKYKNGRSPLVITYNDLPKNLHTSIISSRKFEADEILHYLSKRKSN